MHFTWNFRDTSINEKGKITWTSLIEIINKTFLLIIKYFTLDVVYYFYIFTFPKIIESVHLLK